MTNKNQAMINLELDRGLSGVKISESQIVKIEGKTTISIPVSRGKDSWKV